MWSEHCSYKSSRVHLKRLPTRGPRVLQGPGENAGVVDIGHGLAAVFKVESHNHPSFIEPFQGAATGVGGIIRDIFTMGARPIALMNSLRFGPLSIPKNRSILTGVAAGIASYGNSMGIPTVSGEVELRRVLQPEPSGERILPGHRSQGSDLPRSRRRRGEPRVLRRREDGKGRNPRRHHGVRGVRRGGGGKAPHGPGGRSLSREAPPRGLPRAHGDRCARRDPGHGSGRSHLRHLRDGSARAERASRSSSTRFRSASAG